MTNIVLCIDTTIDDTEATGSAVQAHMEVVLTFDKVSIIDARADEDRNMIGLYYIAVSIGVCIFAKPNSFYISQIFATINVVVFVVTSAFATISDNFLGTDMYHHNIWIG